LFATLKAETDPVFALIDAQKKLKDAQKAYTSAVKAHGRNSAEAARRTSIWPQAPWVCRTRSGV
jgi:hypothetical protein